MMRTHDIRSFYDSLSEKFKEFLHHLEQEKEETKQAFEILKDSVVNNRQLSVEEKHQIGNQLKDVLKTVGLVTLASLPGGSLFFVFFNFLKLNRYILPSAFNTDIKKIEN